MDARDWIPGGFLVLFGIVFLYLVLSLGRAMYVDAQCLSLGFPKSNMTWNWKGYCLNMKGAVEGFSVPLDNAR